MLKSCVRHRDPKLLVDYKSFEAIRQFIYIITGCTSKRQFFDEEIVHTVDNKTGNGSPNGNKFKNRNTRELSLRIKTADVAPFKKINKLLVVIILIDEAREIDTFAIRQFRRGESCAADYRVMSSLPEVITDPHERVESFSLPVFANESQHERS